MEFWRHIGIILLSSFILQGSLTYATTFEEVAGLIDPTSNKAFVLVPKKYTKSRSDIYVKLSMYTSFLELEKAAQASGINLRITSGRRSFSGQQTLFNQYGFDRALPPGTSSHHFGQAIDFANTADGGGAYARLKKHANMYGFCQTYDGHSSGQGAESRHYEYHPEEYREAIITFRDEIYLYLHHQNILSNTGMTKQELFDTYVYPISHSCIDDYPSRIDDVVTGIRFDRRLDSSSPDNLVYTLSRYKFPAGTGLLDFLPPEVRFEKTKDNGLRFATLIKYPARVQDLMVDYQQRFRDGVERFVLLRTFNQIVAASTTKVSYVGEKQQLQPY